LIIEHRGVIEEREKKRFYPASLVVVRSVPLSAALASVSFHIRSLATISPLFAYPFVKNTAITIIAIISTLDGHFGHTMDNTAYRHSISIGSGNFNSLNNVTNIHNKFVTVSRVIADENPEVVQWLSPLEPRRRHQDVRIDKLDGVGNWMLETSEFREWRSNENGADKAVLFCCGDPGVGKTYLR